MSDSWRVTWHQREKHRGHTRHMAHVLAASAVVGAFSASLEYFSLLPSHSRPCIPPAGYGI